MMSYVEINPKYARSLAEAGLACAADFLACAGEPVCIRPDRRVDRLALANGVVVYLKKETRVLLRERLSSWCSGYGWTSKSVREGIVLGDLSAHNIGCPTVVALGEEAGQAFVALKEERDLLPIDDFLRRHPDRSRRIAQLLGRELARMHEAGFFHPDLFAKHVLVGPADGLDRVCLIDWQRTRRISSVSWSRRIADIATLDASLANDTACPRDRLRLLAAYLNRVTGRRPRLQFFVDAIRRRSRLIQSGAESLGNGWRASGRRPPRSVRPTGMSGATVLSGSPNPISLPCPS